MPHLVLEYSANVTQEVEWHGLFQRLHQAVAAAGAPLAGCKSRAVRHETYYVGEGQPDGAFVHLTVGVLSGRTDEEKATIARPCLRLLVEEFRPSLDNLDLQITVEVRDLHRASYQKVP